MIYLINYSNEKYAKQQKYCSYSALTKGRVNKVIEYSPKDIPESYIEQHKNIFSYKRGAGLWIWKPYIILDALNKIGTDDYLMYCDSGTYFVDNIRKLIKAMDLYKQEILTFELPLLERQFTKKETFNIVNIDNYGTNQRLTGYILLKKTAFTISFINKWLEIMENEVAVSYNHFNNEIKEFDDFFEHREDQSVFSLLCLKHNITPFRDPSQFGDRPWMYARSEYSYCPKKYENSAYPKILVSCRAVNPVKYKIVDFLQTLLNRLGIFTKTYYFKKHGISPLKCDIKKQF